MERHGSATQVNTEPQPDIARVAALFAEPARSRIVLHLLDGRALPASQLATSAGIAPSTASAHLARLVAEGVLNVEQHGRHRYYRIGDPRVVALVEALTPLAHTPEPSGLRAHHRMARLRTARTCYDHAAGSLGTRILAGLLDAQALTRTDGHTGTEPATHDALSSTVREAPYVLGPNAHTVFAAIGIDLDAPRSASRPLIRACMDWTEQRHHLSGALGAMTLDALVGRGWIESNTRPRELVVHHPGAVDEWLGT